MIVERPKMIDGRSEWDVAYEERVGPVPAFMRAVPGGLANIADLYRADASKAGRPLRFTLDEAVAIKKGYWSGTNTIKGLAHEHNVTAVTIARLVHGQTYWYA